MVSAKSLSTPVARNSKAATIALAVCGDEFSFLSRSGGGAGRCNAPPEYFDDP
tara:strand:- start:349 stop:507 length:159 start_codon:yes stop_codon:yes gene_type:complete